MAQLFRPLDADPLAPFADTWPYIHNICQYLSQSSANLYRGFIKFFEDGTVSEQTLASMVRDSHLFNDQLYIELLHDDLVLVIGLNKLGDTPQAATPPEACATNVPPTQAASRCGKASSPTMVGDMEDEKGDAENEHMHKSVAG